MKLLCHSISGSRYGRKFCFVNFKPKRNKKNKEKNERESSSCSSLESPINEKPKEAKRTKLNNKTKRRQARFPSITHSSCYTGFSHYGFYERVSSTSSSSVLSTDTVSSDSDSDTPNLPLPRLSATNRLSTPVRNEDPHALLTTTDESDSDFSESEISSAVSSWSLSGSSTSDDAGERELEFYSDPDNNRQSAEITHMPILSEFIEHTTSSTVTRNESSIADQVQLTPLDLLSESLFRAFGIDVGCLPCPRYIVDALFRRYLDAKDLAEGPSCAICCTDLKSEEEVMDLPCNHFYHTECICSWLKLRSTCPTCRFELSSLECAFEETEV